MIGAISQSEITLFKVPCCPNSVSFEIAAPKVNQAARANSADRQVVVNSDEQVLGAKTP